MQPVGVVNLFNSIKGNISLVLMHSGNGNVNGYQLLFEAHTVFEPRRGTAAFLLFYSLSSFPLFLFMCLSLLTVLFLGASIVCVNNL